MTIKRKTYPKTFSKKNFKKILKKISALSQSAQKPQNLKTSIFFRLFGLTTLVALVKEKTFF